MEFGDVKGFRYQSFAANRRLQSRTDFRGLLSKGWGEPLARGVDTLVCFCSPPVSLCPCPLLDLSHSQLPRGADVLVLRLLLLFVEDLVLVEAFGQL